MKKIVLIFIASVFTLDVFAQQLPEFKSGKITQEELTMAKCPIDSGAHAFYLFDKGSSKFVFMNNDFRIEFKKHCRLKILTKAGYDYAEFKIPFYELEHSELREYVANIKATTYNLENGKMVVTKLDRKDIFDEKKDKNWSYKNFTLPNVKEGSVLEVEYTIFSDFIWNLPSWYFQRSIPILWSIYEVEIPEYYGYNKEMKGYVSIYKNIVTSFNSSINITSVERSHTSNNASFGMNSDRYDFFVERTILAAKDVPAFKEEPYIDAADNYLSSLSFELSYLKFPEQIVKNYTTTWEEICKRLYDDNSFGSHLSGTSAMKDKAKELGLEGKTEIEKARAVFGYVKKATKWDNHNSIYSESIRSTVDKGTGSSGDINMMLINLLDAAGLDVFPVVLKSRYSGSLPITYPSLSELNYVIAAVKISNDLILLDATEDAIPFNFLPMRCINGKGIMINKDKTMEWIDLSKRSYSSYLTSANLTVGDDGEIAGTVDQRCDGQRALTRRLSLDVNKDEIIKKIEEENNGLSVVSYSNENLDNTDKPLYEKLEVGLTGFVTIAGDMVYLKPCLYEALEENPFKSEDRKYPVDFGNIQDIKIAFTFNVPENWAIQNVPADQKVSLPDNSGYFRSSVTKLNNQVFYNMQIKIDKIVFLPQEYDLLKEFFHRIAENNQQQIVFKKS